VSYLEDALPVPEEVSGHLQGLLHRMLEAALSRQYQISRAL
jgi:hypothetical protein